MRTEAEARRKIKIEAGQVWEKGGGKAVVFMCEGQNIGFKWEGPAEHMPPLTNYWQRSVDKFSAWAKTATLVKAGGGE